MLYGAYKKRYARRGGRGRRVYKRRNLGSYINRKISTALDKNIESKFLDTNFDSGTGGVVSGTYVITKLTATVLGQFDNGGRIGDIISMKNLQMRFNMVAADTANRIRVSVIRWMDDDGFNPPTSGQIYQSGNIQSFFNMDSLKAGKFKVIHDKCYDIDVSDALQLQIKLFKKLYKQKVKYTSGGSTGTGHLFFIYTSDSGVVPHPTIDVTSRLVYKDA